jgi:hypothetical protein
VELAVAETLLELAEQQQQAVLIVAVAVAVQVAVPVVLKVGPAVVVLLSYATQSNKGIICQRTT